MKTILKSVFIFLFCLLLFVGCGGKRPVQKPPQNSAQPDFAAYGRNLFRIGSRAYEKCTINEATSQKYAELVGEAAEALKGETRVYSLIIPTAYGIMPNEEEKKLIPDYIETESSISAVYDAMPESVTTLSVWDRLKSHSDEFIYFRTDPHWTARGAYLGYEAFCEAKGIEPIPIDDHRTESFTGFLGSFYYEVGCDEKLLPEEIVEAFYPISEGVELTVTDEKGNTEVRPMVADVSELSSSAKYQTFAGWNNPFSVIVNPTFEDASTLIIVKESFGNPLPAFLCDHYSTVYLIDYRYWDGNIIDFAREVNADDLLFANNINAVNAGSNVGFIAMIIKQPE